MYPLSYLAELFSNYFSETIMKIRNELYSHTCLRKPAQIDCFSDVTLSTIDIIEQTILLHRL